MTNFDKMEQNFVALTEEELMNVDGGALPLLIPIAAGFVKGFIYTGGAILTTRALLSGN